MTEIDLSELNEEIKSTSAFIEPLVSELHKTIIGQDDLIEKLIIALIADGHVLLEGVPGLAKTLTVKTLAFLIKTQFHRIQFTPDLLPADILGTLIYNFKEGSFEVNKGPIFSNIILADEINRSPAKVQSALLEAMEERQITIGDETYQLENPFLVLATQNPIEQEGTYPLPEAQIDRFMFKVLVDYPNKHEELQILNKMSYINRPESIKPIININDILDARILVDKIHMAENIKQYIIDIIDATRNPIDYNLKDMNQLILYGASPRASIFLAKASKAQAFIQHRGYVIPEDIREVGRTILRHRILLTYEAEAEEITSEEIITRLFESIPTP